jgi:fumarylpyruvate hydrolase
MKLHTVTAPTLAIADTPDRFPVRRIYCVGQNYADHAREMGNDPTRTPPFFFAKPADTVVASGSQLPFPGKTVDLHHEVELVIALRDGGAGISAKAAADKVFGYAVGIDLTRRDLQAEAKKLGRPWEMAKGFDHSAPIGTLTQGMPPPAADISLTLNGDRRQSGNLNQMIWGVVDVIAILSEYVTLAAGDLIFTGTPAGVGRIERGDELRGEISGTSPIEVSFKA